MSRIEVISKSHSQEGDATTVVPDSQETDTTTVVPELKTYTYEYVRANGKKRIVKRSYQPRPKGERPPIVRISKKRAPVLKYIEDHKADLEKLPMHKRAVEVVDKVFIELKIEITEPTVRKLLTEAGLYESRCSQKREKLAESKRSKQ